ncbi:AP-5 complex subunit beta-1-like [Liolophura sinensis]|uniref:AP-5 complex subunit beta-1-like n=1 Tax=Liolophura sinensis TaxID=3198878 RepID=UPI003157F4BF
MAGNRPTELTGAAEWSETLYQLKQALSLGITERRISDEFFVFDLLKGVCEDGVQEVTRVQLLTFLEEHGQLLIQQDNVEQVLASLLDIFQQGQKTGTSGPFLCQVLTTLTTILVEFDQLGKAVDICQRILETLLTIVSQVNDTAQLLLRSHACSCLLELEISYPTLLRNKLECLYSAVKAERSWLYEDYVCLLTCVLQHALAALVTSGDNVTDNKLTDLVCNRKEEIKDCPDLQTPFYTVTHSDDLPTFNPSVEAKEVLQIISHIMEHSVMFTPAGLVTVVTQLIKIVTQIPALSPIVFKPVLLQYLPTMDLSLLQLVLTLKRVFNGVLLSELEEKALLQHFMFALNHPGYAAAHRLLIYQWLFHYDSKTGVSESDHLPVRLSDQSYDQLFPSVFDGVDTQVVKLRSLSLCLKPGAESDMASAVLMSSLVNLHKTVQHNVSGRATVALFRVLFTFYRQHLESCLPQDIKQFIIGLVSNSIQLVPYAIDFLNSLTQLPQSSGVHLEILKALHRQVVQSPAQDVTSQLDYVLQVLQKAATEKQINPKMTLNFLQRVLEWAPQLLQGNWVHGNAVLAVGRNILQHHSTDLIYNELGRLFHSMMTTYDDVDIKDRARFYYALLTGASDEKIGLVLTNSTAKNGTSNSSLQSIVAGPGGFLNQTTLTELEKSPVTWTRLTQRYKWTPQPPAISQDSVTQRADPVRLYLEQLDMHSPVLEFNFQLRMVDICDFDQLLAVTIEIETNSNCEPVKDVHLSCLLPSEEKSFTVDLIPKLPLPMSYPARVMFTSPDSRTYSCQLEPVDVRFEDYFVPVPITLCTDTDPELFFNRLWTDTLLDKVTSDNTSGERGVQSVYSPKFGMEKMEKILCGKLKPFVINSNSDTHVHRVAILLPVHHHLLMKIEPVDGRVIIHTATDLWEILGVLQTFLDNLHDEGTGDHS